MKVGCEQWLGWMGCIASCYITPRFTVTLTLGAIGLQYYRCLKIHQLSWSLFALSLIHFVWSDDLRMGFFLSSFLWSSKSKIHQVQFGTGVGGIFYINKFISIIDFMAFIKEQRLGSHQKVTQQNSSSHLCRKVGFRWLAEWMQLAGWMLC